MWLLALAACADSPAPVVVRGQFAPPVGEYRNVLLVCLDCVRPDHIGAYGYDERPSSPWLDELAERSIVFESAWAASTWTKSSVPSYLTGLLPVQHGVFEGVMIGRERALSDSLPGAAVSVAEAFQENLYDTACIASNAQIGEEFGFGQGFRHFVNRPSHGRGIVTQAAEWLRERDDSTPYFLYLHFIDTHWPYRIPSSFQARFSTEEAVAQIGLEEGAPWFLGVNRGEIELSPEQIETWRAIYDGSLSYSNDLLAQLMPVVEATSGGRETVLCVISDHGEDLLEYGTFGHGENLRNETLRVPWIFHVPGVEPRRVKEHVSLTELPARLLEASGLDETLPAAGDRPPLHGAVFSELSLEAAYQQCWIRGDHKLVREYRATPDLRAQLDPGTGRLRAARIRALLRLGPEDARSLGWTVTDRLYEVAGREDRPVTQRRDLQEELADELEEYCRLLLEAVLATEETTIKPGQLQELDALGYR